MSIWDALERAAYTGLGLAAMTKDKIEDAVETLKKERGLTEDEGRRLAEELKDGADNARRNLEERVSEAVDKALGSVNLVKSERVEALERRIEELEKQLNGDSGD